MRNFVIFLMLFMTYSLSHASIYKCISESGKTVFQQNPCSGGKDVKEHKISQVNTAVRDPNINIIKNLKLENDISEQKNLINQKIIFNKQDNLENQKKKKEQEQEYENAKAMVMLMRTSAYSTSQFSQALEIRSKAYSKLNDTERKIRDTEYEIKKLSDAFDKLDEK